MKRTALITGSAKRIGKTIASHLASQGWNIAIHCNHSVKEAQELCSSLSEKFSQNHYQLICADLNNQNEVDRIIPETIERFGQLDLLINNASIFEPSSILHTTPALFNRMINVNFRAPFFLIKNYFEVQKKGLIINLLDTRIVRNEPDFAAYTLSKKSLFELTKMAAIEFGPSFRVNAIAPGAALPPAGKDKSYLQNIARKTPLKYPGGVIPVLKSIDFIIENDYLTGQIIFCDGGENVCKAL